MLRRRAFRDSRISARGEQLRAHMFIVHPSPASPPPNPDFEKSPILRTHPLGSVRSEAATLKEGMDAPSPPPLAHAQLAAMDPLYQSPAGPMTSNLIADTECWEYAELGR